MRALRATILAAADSPLVRRFVARYGMRLGAARFVAGETLDECVGVLPQRSPRAGCTRTRRCSGESVRDRRRGGSGRRRVRPGRPATRRRAAADERRAEAHAPRARARRGARLRERRARRRRGREARDVRADRHGAVERRGRDAQDLPAAARRAVASGVGTVLQAYLYRTPDDLELCSRSRRTCGSSKGAYLEPAEIATRARRTSTPPTRDSSRPACAAAHTSRSRRTTSG